MTTQKPLRTDARRNREAIIRAAREIFAEEEADAPFEDFARRAGVGVGTLYRNFPNRESLVAAVFHEEVDALGRRAHHLLNTRSPDEALRVFLHEMVDLIYTQRGLGRTFFAASEAKAGGISDESRVIEKAVAAILSQGIEESVIRDDVSAGAVMLALHGISIASIHSERRADSDDVVKLLADGLRPGH